MVHWNCSHCVVVRHLFCAVTFSFLIQMLVLPTYEESACNVIVIASNNRQMKKKKKRRKNKLLLKAKVINVKENMCLLSFIISFILGQFSIFKRNFFVLCVDFVMCLTSICSAGIEWKSKNFFDLNSFDISRQDLL